MSFFTYQTGENEREKLPWGNVELSHIADGNAFGIVSFKGEGSKVCITALNVHTFDAINNSKDIT
jgi:hypothetical protein